MSEDEAKKPHRDICNGCGVPIGLEQIIAGDDFRPLGMVVESPGSGVFCFTHVADACGETLAIPLDRFTHLIAEPIPDEILHGSDVCERHCVQISDLEHCAQACGNAPYRKLMVGWVARWAAEHSI